MAPAAETVQSLNATGARRRIPAHLFVGLAALVASEVMLFARIEPVFTYFYQFAWWSYIVAADGVVYWRTGNSLLVSRRREFVVMVFWSVVFWNIYEVFNFRLQNWYYVLVPTNVWAGRVHAMVAYATVLPGVFETVEILESFKPFERLRVPPWRINRGVLGLFVALGLASMALPLIWPDLFFPLVWGVATFVLEPIVYLKGGRSLLREFERGDPRKFVYLWIGGTLAGGMWEFWNFWTRTKWIYTVPGFENLKLFEMPVLGFIGFSPFVIECYVMYAFLGLFRGNRGWERDAYRTGRSVGLPLTVLAAIAALVFNFLVFEGINRWSVRSRNTTLAELPGMTAAAFEKLSGVGIVRGPDLLRATDSLGVAALSARVGVDADLLKAAAATAEFVEAKGLGVDDYRLLAARGITTFEALSREDVAGLTEALAIEAARVGRPPPTERQVGVWIREARRQVGLAKTTDR